MIKGTDILEGLHNDRPVHNLVYELIKHLVKIVSHPPAFLSIFFFLSSDIF